MFVNLKMPLSDIEGKPISFGALDKTGAQKQACVGDVMLQAVIADHQQDGTKPEHKVRRWNMAKFISKRLSDDGDGQVQMPSEDIAFAKERISMFYGVGILGPVFDALESGPAVSAIKAPESTL